MKFDFPKFGKQALKATLVVVEHTDLTVSVLARFLASRYEFPLERPEHWPSMSEALQARWRDEARAVIRELRGLL